MGLVTCPQTRAGVAEMEDLSPCIDRGACGAGIRVVDTRTGSCAISAFDLFMQESRVSLASFGARAGKRVRGQMRIEFRIEYNNLLHFGYALIRGAPTMDFYSAAVWTRQAWKPMGRGDTVEFCALPIDTPCALLFDMDAGTLGYEVNGRFVGTAFTGLHGTMIEPVFFMAHGGSRLIITRVLSNASALVPQRAMKHEQALSCAQYPTL